MMNLTDNALLRNFVSPQLCKDLLDLGLTTKPAYQWKVKSNTTELYTNAFDVDDYYIAAVKHIDAVNPPLYILPAFTIKDVEHCLPPDWVLTNGPSGYEVSLGKIFEVESRTAQRMPDAFALLLKLLIKKNMIDMHRINQLLNIR